MSKQSLLADLVYQVKHCNLCPRMRGRNKVMGSSNGNLDASVMFIAEAPGRLGADKFGIPLYGDQTGRNFEMLLASAGLDRVAIFITNAVLCNPRSPHGNNDSPTMAEIRNCSTYLKHVIDIVKPKYIVPIGAVALTALGIIEAHGVKLSQGVGSVFGWQAYNVYPLYHPGPRAFIHRTRAQQMEDYKILGKILADIKYPSVSWVPGKEGE